MFFYLFIFSGKEGFWLTRKAFFDFLGRKLLVFGHISSTEYVSLFQTWIFPSCSSNRLPVDLFESWVWIATIFLRETDHTRRLQEFLLQVRRIWRNHQSAVLSSAFKSAFTSALTSPFTTMSWWGSKWPFNLKISI